KQRRLAARGAKGKGSPPSGPGVGAKEAASLQTTLDAAIQAHQAGRLAEAGALYDRVLRSQPNNAQALNLRGVTAHQTGASDAGIELIRRAIRLRPDVADFHNNLGNVLKAEGKLREAVAAYNKAIEADPAYPVAYLNLGVALKALGDVDEAFAAYRKAIELKPDYAEACSNLGNALHQQGRLEEALIACRKAVELAPRLAEAGSNLGNVLMEQGMLDEAAAQYARVLSFRPDLAETHTKLGDVLRKQGKLDDAMKCFTRALRLKPDSAEAHNDLGNAFKEQGKLDRAVESYRRAIECRPDCVQAHYNLAVIERAREGDPAFEVLEPLRDDPSLPLNDAIEVHFTLGKMYADIGEHERAFRRYRRGNELRTVAAERRGQRFDAVQHRRLIDRTIEIFTAGFFAERRGYGAEPELPVLIVGMPRSGTTLIEQILASHPKVFGAGELPDLGNIARGLPERYPEGAVTIDAATSRRLADGYLRRLSAFSADADRVTDKMPGNFMLFGLVALLVPGARVVHCRRDPLDTCLSCYFHNFAHGQHFTSDLRDLGAYYREYERLMAHWREVLPLSILDVQYEELVAHQEEVSREMVAFCGLEWDARCLEFHKTERPVRTASNVQVRQKIFSTSVERWRAYEKHLAPLRDALGMEE
ncbi:MAG: tetratricopeptide repeat protein, partial [Alphaproteobacteria bacterium]